MSERLVFKDRVEYRLNGELHRADGPAVEGVNDANGYNSWYLKGKYHRADGPAIEYVCGYKVWYLNGERHRADGPAVEIAVENSWLMNGKSWYLNGVLHRADGPAIERADGFKAWYLNGKRHRTDGPAIEYANGKNEWWVNGIETTHLRNKLKKLVRVYLLRRGTKRLAQSWALKCAIEWRPPHGVQFVRMIEGIDGSL